MASRHCPVSRMRGRSAARSAGAPDRAWAARPRWRSEGHPQPQGGGQVSDPRSSAPGGTGPTPFRGPCAPGGGALHPQGNAPAMHRTLPPPFQGGSRFHQRFSGGCRCRGRPRLRSIIPSGCSRPPPVRIRCPFGMPLATAGSDFGLRDAVRIFSHRVTEAQRRGAADSREQTRHLLHPLGATERSERSLPAAGNISNRRVTSGRRGDPNAMGV